MWENFIINYGKEISFDSRDIENACLRINKQLNMKNELLNIYLPRFFREELEKQFIYQHLTDKH